MIFCGGISPPPQRVSCAFSPELGAGVLLFFLFPRGRFPRGVERGDGRRGERGR